MWALSNMYHSLMFPVIPHNFLFASIIAKSYGAFSFSSKLALNVKGDRFLYQYFIKRIALYTHACLPACAMFFQAYRVEIAISSCDGNSPTNDFGSKTSKSKSKLTSTKRKTGIGGWGGYLIANSVQARADHTRRIGHLTVHCDADECSPFASMTLRYVLLLEKSKTSSIICVRKPSENASL